MSGVTFQVLLGSGATQLTPAYLTGVNGLSGSFVLPPGGALIVIGCTWQQSSGTGTLSGTISGISATSVCVSGLSPGSRQAGIIAAVVPSGAPGTFSLSGPTVSSSRVMSFVWSITGAGRVNDLNATSVANNPTATLSVIDNSVEIGCSIGGAASPPTASWSGLTSDANTSFSLQTFTAAHKKFTAAGSNTAACTMSGTAGSAGAFALFKP